MYRDKYFKYKNKYLELKNLKGDNIDKLFEIQKIYDNEVKSMIFKKDCELFLNLRHEMMTGIETQNTSLFGGNMMYSIRYCFLDLVSKKEKLLKFICDKINNILHYDKIKLFTDYDFDKNEYNPPEYLLFNKYYNSQFEYNLDNYNILSFINSLTNLHKEKINSYNNIDFKFEFPPTMDKNVIREKFEDDIILYSFINKFEIEINFDIEVGNFIIVNNKYYCRVWNVEKLPNCNNKIKISIFDEIKEKMKPIYVEKKIIDFINPLDDKIDLIINNEQINILRVNEIVNVKIGSKKNKLCKILEIKENPNEFEILLFDLKNMKNIIVKSFFKKISDNLNIKNIKKYPTFVEIVYANGTVEKIDNNLIISEEDLQIPIHIEKEYIPDDELHTRINYIKKKFLSNYNLLLDLYGEDFMEYLSNYINSYIMYLESIINLSKIEIPSTLGLYFDNVSSNFKNPDNYDSIFTTNIYSYDELLFYKRYDETNRILLNPKKKTIMIIGGGPIGLLTGFIFKEKYHECNVMIIENRTVNLFRKSSYSRFQEIQFNMNYIPKSIEEYLLPVCKFSDVLEETPNNSLAIQLKVIETILLYFCHKIGIIIHYENKTYNLDNLINNIKPIMLFNASGKIDLNFEIIKNNPLIKNDWIYNFFQQKNCENIIKINSSSNIYQIMSEKYHYYLKYDSINNIYIYCDKNGNPIVKRYVYLLISRNSPEHLAPILSMNKLFAFKNYYNATFEIPEQYYDEILNIFKELNVPAINNKMHNFNKLTNLLNCIFKDNLFSTVQDKLSSNVQFNNNEFELLISKIKDYLTISNVFSVPLYFSATSSNIINSTDYKFLYMLVGDSYAKDYFYTGQAINKWINVINKFVDSINIYEKFITKK